MHIHVKVHVGGKVVHTGQLFFADSLTDKVYAAAPYSNRPNRDVRNAQDSIFVNGGKRGLLAVRRSPADTAARSRWASTGDVLDRRARRGNRRARRRSAVAGVQHRRGRAVGTTRYRRRRDAVVHRPPLRLARARAAGRGRCPGGCPGGADGARRAARIPAGRDDRSSRQNGPVHRRALHPVRGPCIRRRLGRAGEHARRGGVGRDGARLRSDARDRWRSG